MKHSESALVSSLGECLPCCPFIKGVVLILSAEHLDDLPAGDAQVD
jgi:hypothetical protein